MAGYLRSLNSHRCWQRECNVIIRSNDGQFMERSLTAYLYMQCCSHYSEFIHICAVAMEYAERFDCSNAHINNLIYFIVLFC